ncbi:MAG: gfo/Idh/MocA family oxidoreductase, partial [Saprospiraceae bacterium]|nr:gfo/Idh/MocA family oxidoreductase [Saprospiraceae bacterium]
GLFGEMIHLECGYQHDLRAVKFNDGITAYKSGVEFGKDAFSEARWRTWHSVYRNGELYPTHGIGPVAHYVNLNRGNRLTHLTSMSSKSRGLHDYIVSHEKGGANHPNAKVEFALGDKVTTLLRTANGETIVMHHDTNLPRPYSLGFRVQGTKGLWMDVNSSLHIEGKSPEHRWEEAASYLKEYDHPLWKKYGEEASGAGHGGMDFFLLHAFVESVKKGEPAPIDVYDAATWMAITPMSEESIQKGSQPVSFPDFTRGKWMYRKPIFAFTRRIFVSTNETHVGWKQINIFTFK